MSTYLECQDGGATLTTWVYCAMWQLYAAHKEGKTGYIHWPNEPRRSLTPYRDAQQFGRQPNMFEWYFIQPDHKEQPPCNETWLWGDTMQALGRHRLYGEPLSLIKQWYRDHLRFSPAVEQRGRALLVKYGLNELNAQNLVGLTWRGTDIYLDGRPYLPIEVYYPFIDEALELNPSARIACTAEEDGVLDPLLARYPQAFRVDEFASVPRGHKANPERKDSRTGFERGMQPALMVWLFSKCGTYIKNRSSTGAVASWLSSGRIVCLAHDERLDYGPPSPIVHPKTGEVLWKP